MEIIRNMNILITGGAGFIGSNLAEYHIGKGDKVYVIDDLSTGSEGNIQGFKKQTDFKFVKADILTCPELEKAVEWADRIYHMAAVVGIFKVLKEPLHVLSVNMTGTLRLLEAIQRSGQKPQVILASSSELYGPSTQTTLKEDDNIIIRPNAKNRWNYPVSKLLLEALGLSYYQQFGIPIVIARLFNTIGLRQTGRYGMVVPRFVQAAIKNEPITVFGDGNQTRSFCDVRDVVVMLDKLASTKKAIGEIVNVGHDREISINALAEKVKSIAQSDSLIKHLSYFEAYGEHYLDISQRKPNLTKLSSLIDFKPQRDLDHSIYHLINATL